MIMQIIFIKPEVEMPFTHTLSKAFLTALRSATLMINQGKDEWKKLIQDALVEEFPRDREIREFAEESFSRIVGFLLKELNGIYIHRSMSQGLELFVDD